MTDQPTLTRRDAMAATALAGAGTLVPWGAVQAQPAAPAREKTMILVWGGREGRWVDYDLWNPYSIGSNHQICFGILHLSVYLKAQFNIIILTFI